MWGDDLKSSDKTANGLAYIPAPKPKLPGSMDGTMRLWDVQRGRCRKVWDFDIKVNNVQSNPNPQINILAVAVDKYVVLLSTVLGGEEVSDNVFALFDKQKSGGS